MQPLVIPAHGLKFDDESTMKKVLCGAKGKTMKGANTVFAQDSQSNAILEEKGSSLPLILMMAS